MDIVVVLLIKKTGFIHLQCKYGQAGEAMTLFSVVISLLTACTGLDKRAGTDHLGHGCAAVKCTVNIAFPRQNFGQGTGNVPQSSLGEIAAMFLPALLQPLTPHCRILSPPVVGAATAPMQFRVL